MGIACVNKLNKGYLLGDQWCF